jgi:hypothetical protein
MSWIDEMPSHQMAELRDAGRIGSSRFEGPTPERCDYEPGDMTHPMHTDPLCRICGQPKRARTHE